MGKQSKGSSRSPQDSSSRVVGVTATSFSDVPFEFSLGAPLSPPAKPAYNPIGVFSANIAEHTRTTERQFPFCHAQNAQPEQALLELNGWQPVPNITQYPPAPVVQPPPSPVPSLGSVPSTDVWASFLEPLPLEQQPVLAPQSLKKRVRRRNVALSDKHRQDMAKLKVLMAKKHTMKATVYSKNRKEIARSLLDLTISNVEKLAEEFDIVVRDALCKEVRRAKDCDSKRKQKQIAAKPQADDLSEQLVTDLQVLYLYCSCPLVLASLHATLCDIAGSVEEVVRTFRRNDNNVQLDLHKSPTRINRRLRVEMALHFLSLDPYYHSEVQRLSFAILKLPQPLPLPPTEHLPLLE